MKQNVWIKLKSNKTKGCAKNKNHQPIEPENEEIRVLKCNVHSSTASSTALGTWTTYRYLKGCKLQYDVRCVLVFFCSNQQFSSYKITFISCRSDRSMARSNFRLSLRENKHKGGGMTALGVGDARILMP